ncbi:hypothetical protein D3C87_1790560 [compost metagenome]
MLVASICRTCSSVCSRRISRSKASIFFVKAVWAGSAEAMSGSWLPASSVRNNSRALSSTLDKAVSLARRRARSSWSGSSRRASITPRVTGSIGLEAFTRLSGVGGSEPDSSSCKALRRSL